MGDGERGGTIRFRLFWWGGCFTFHFLQVSGFFVVLVFGMGEMEVGWDTANLCG